MTLNAQQFQPQSERQAAAPTPLWANATFRKGDVENPLCTMTSFPRSVDLGVNPKGYVDTVEQVPVGKLESTQPTVQSAKLEALADVDPAKLPPVEVTHVDGHYWLKDGNHRAVRAHLDGDATVLANVRRPRSLG